MRDAIFHIDRDETLTLQDQIQEKLVSAILSGSLAPGSPLPSTRLLATRLRVSRNTVTLAYQSLATDGYLVPKERSGFFVAEDVVAITDFISRKKTSVRSEPLDVSKWLAISPSEQQNIEKPANWHDYPFPFIYGQSDPALFPFHEWRECTRQAVSRKLVEAWTDDSINQDDPMFVEQIRQRLLPRRGIDVSPDEILVTMGAQNAIYLFANLIVGKDTRVGIEDPGYPDARNIFSLKTDNLQPLPLDEQGVVIGDELKSCQVAFVTPSHQMPTNITMGIDRRRALLAWAADSGSMIIEDDYEFETNYLGTPTPALKSLDSTNNVLYVSSLSKSLVPGLRIGYMVGSRELIEEARALRRLMFRHPPGNNQRVAALFLALGHHNSLIGRLHRTYKTRWHAMKESLDTHLPDWAQSSNFGGTAFWMRGPEWLDSRELKEQALEFGVLIEPGDVFFADQTKKRNFFRLGFSSIPTERIEPGIAKLATAVQMLEKNR